MSKSNEADLFYASIPVFDSFGGLMEPALYKPLPDDWTIGIADIVQSTKAIRENRYRSVNMAGAAVIAALKNALGGNDFPYVFGGDGASFAVPAQDLARAWSACRHHGVGEGRSRPRHEGRAGAGRMRARKAPTCVWPVSRPRQTSPTQCSLAAD